MGNLYGRYFQFEVWLGMSNKVQDKPGISRRDLFRRSGTLGVGLLAAAGCGGTSEEFVVTNNNNNPNPNPTITPTPPPPAGGGLTFLFVKAQSATVPASTTSFEFVYLGGAKKENAELRRNIELNRRWRSEGK